MTAKPRVLLVTGSRSIRSADVVHAFLDAYLDTADASPITDVIHGGAPGVDTRAGAWAKARGFGVRVVRPDFQTWPVARHRWKAYTQRDRDMVDAADDVVAIWDGTSSGTRLTFEYAEAKGKLRQIYYATNKIHN